MQIEKLKEHFDNYFPLDSAEQEALNKLFSEKNIKRRHFVLEQGEVCKHFTFVVSGCLRMYAVDTHGKEHNLQFIPENDWATDLSSFYSEQPSQLFIQALEPSRVLQIRHDNVLYLYTKYHKFDHNFRVIFEQKYIESQNRTLQNISSSAEDRYQHFLRQYSNLSNRLSNVQIASYLGITPEFLSVIRRANAYK
ncbi:Crp/Fnr family transcriptional regulator [Mucilaginibacter sp. 14171R-50]|uniref:Crp/Fnr family transcriptional regulator n=1 Tax=Mucilaginibacter sp. 14171R-50 TaxID=2703789 RepID=UPI00138B5B98|nr:Crp/Fnr family transcriptional regulator [Mucilaginibacter sp. 14171R-50]QHS55627.1 Crp/Fnr family transcriptional regulator [Mucilaginibacter sp. 14171R-50]